MRYPAAVCRGGHARVARGRPAIPKAEVLVYKPVRRCVLLCRTVIPKRYALQSMIHCIFEDSDRSEDIVALSIAILVVVAIFMPSRVLEKVSRGSLVRKEWRHPHLFKRHLVFPIVHQAELMGSRKRIEVDALTGRTHLQGQHGADIKPSCQGDKTEQEVLRGPVDRLSRASNRDLVRHCDAKFSEPSNGANVDFGTLNERSTFKDESSSHRRTEGFALDDCDIDCLEQTR